MPAHADGTATRPRPLNHCGDGRHTLCSCGAAHAVEFLKAWETGEGLAGLEYESECENQSRGVCGGASASARSASASEEEDDFFDRAAAASWAATAITAQEPVTFLVHAALSG